MAKVKSIYFCKECGGEHVKWQGKCNFCHSWNTLSEQKVQGSKSKASSASQILSQNTAQLSIQDGSIVSEINYPQVTRDTFLDEGLPNPSSI